MVNFQEIEQAYVDAWSTIPDLRMAMNAVTPAQFPNIVAYGDLWPAVTSVSHAIRDMKRPGILVYYLGQEPEDENGNPAHRLRAVIRMGKSTASDDPAILGYSAIIKAMVDGVPGILTNIPDGLRMIDAVIHPACDPMKTPAWQRLTDTDDTDYFEFTTTVVERVWG